MEGVGGHEVVIESPDATVALADLSAVQVADVFTACQTRVRDLVGDRRLRYLLVFKNHGVEAGSTIPHSHTQIIGLPVTPSTVRSELQASKAYYLEKGSCLVCDRLTAELVSGERLVAENAHAAAYTPYAGRFPFEVTITRKIHGHDFGVAREGVIKGFAEVVREVLGRLKAVLKDPPYNFAMHSAPNTESEPRPEGYWDTIKDDFHWHLEVIPQLTRVAGFEWGTGFYVNPMPPEEAAACLRELK